MALPQLRSQVNKTVKPFQGSESRHSSVERLREKPGRRAALDEAISSSTAAALR